MSKDTFIIRTEWHNAISELKPADQLTIYNNLFYYHDDKENLINLNNLQVKLVWKLIEPNLKRNIDSYDRRKETSSENGKKGGRPPKVKPEEKPNNLKNNLSEPKKPIVSVSVSVSDSVPATENEYDISFEHFWNLYDKKEDRSKSEKAWYKLPDETKKQIIEFVPKYKSIKPDKQFRKNPMTFFNNKTWLDEIFEPHKELNGYNHAIEPENNKW